MPPTIYTARVSYRGPDRLDITRKAGSVYGPSWALLGPMLAARREGKPMDWPPYKAAYLREMQAVDLAPLLRKDVVTLCCYCTSKTECHRYALAELLVQHGAVYLGERGAVQQSLF